MQSSIFCDDQMSKGGGRIIEAQLQPHREMYMISVPLPAYHRSFSMILAAWR